MNPALIAVLVSALLLGIIAIAIYNGLVRARVGVRESSSTVDTELKRRHDLIPNLIATVKGYMAHERDLLTKLVELRERAEALRPGQISAEQVRVESELSQTLAGVRARFEAYPDLKASTNFAALQAELANTEDRVQAALRFYNGNVRELNVRCEAFPSVFFARLFHFKPAEFFELEDQAARKPVQVQF